MFDITRYEAMAKLDLPEEQREWASRRAETTLAWLDRMETADTTDVEPLITVLEIENVFREDTAGKSISRDELLAGAPEQIDGYFQAPKTIE